MGALWECLCFALRTLGARDQQNGNYVIISTLLFLLAPLCKSQALKPTPVVTQTISDSRIEQGSTHSYT